MNLLFLDFDGVLNTKYNRFDVHDDPLNRELVVRVSAFVDKVDARVIISSAWRHHFTLDVLRVKLQRKGFRHPQRIIGMTPEPHGTHALRLRGHEIKTWLDAHQGTVERFDGKPLSYVVLDDMDPSCFKHVAHRLVQVDDQVGVTGEDIRRAEELLSRQRKKWPDRKKVLAS